MPDPTPTTPTWDLTWDDTGNKIYETGTDRGVLYPISSEGTYPSGVSWDGLRSITESPSGAEETVLYANNGKYGGLYSAEEFSFTIGAYTSPSEFDACDGTAEIAKGVYAGQQNRSKFGMSYRTLIGNDTDGMEHGYKLHLVYGAVASPTERSHSTVNDSPEAEELSWECKTTPVPVPNKKPSSHLVIKSTEADATKLAALEAILYGTAASGSTAAVAPRLPLPTEVASLMAVSG